VIRINLIPPETLQHRVNERRWRWITLVSGIIGVVVVLFWAFMSLQVAAATAEVDSISQQAAAAETQASQFQVFQKVENDLGVRKDAVVSAKQGAVDWARMLYELGLVLPKDIYLTAFTGTDAGTTGNSTVSLTGQAVDKLNDSPDNGYKSVAKMLVRLADLDQLDSVWLTNTNVAAATTGASTAPMIGWTVSAKISAVASATPSASGN
jgi:Tfp pilus assembly protein PilN